VAEQVIQPANVEVEHVSSASQNITQAFVTKEKKKFSQDTPLKQKIGHYQQ
jgi:hypothetical protein